MALIFPIHRSDDYCDSSAKDCADGYAIIRVRDIRVGWLGPCAIVLLLLGGSCFSGHVAAQKSKEVNMSADRVYRVTDSKSSLEGRLTVLRESDGGSSAVVVELSNPSQDHDVVLKVNTVMSAFIMLTVANEQGTVLSKPARKFDTSETQEIDVVRIGRASSHHWSVPIAAQLDASKLPEQGMKGRLIVNVALQYSKVNGDEQPTDDDFKISVLTFYDLDARFTKAALGEKEKKAEKGKSDE